MKRILTALLLTLSFTLAQAQTRSSSVVHVDGEVYYVHTVEPGQTVYSLARLYDVTQNEIYVANPAAREGIQAGQALKIPAKQPKQLNERQQARIFEEYIVNKGETSYSIARRFGLPVATLVEDNPGLDPAILSLGQTLLIRKKSMGTTSEPEIAREWSDYAEALNTVSDSYTYHLVQKGQTLFSISRIYHLPQAEIEALNDVKDGLRAGSILKIPNKEGVAMTPPTQTNGQGTQTGQPGQAPAPWSTQTGQAQQTTAQATDPMAVESATGGFLSSIFGRKPEPAERVFSRGEEVRVSMMLPIEIENAPQSNFFDFYRGALIALGDLKAMGYTTRMDVYNTGRSPESVEQVISRADFAATDLLIGPVYEECMAPALNFADTKGIPLISPLATVEKLSSPNLCQLAPLPSKKYDKLRRLMIGDKNVVLISSANNDKEFEAEIVPVAGTAAKRLEYAKKMNVSALEGILSRDRENLLVVLSSEENLADELLARISSIINNATARGQRIAPVSVVASSRWARFSNIDKNLFFKLNLCFVTPYYADRSDPAVMQFDRKYINAFNALPSLYAYRGYDAVKMTVAAMHTEGSSLASRLDKASQNLLQTPYDFEQQRNGSIVNEHWVLVMYKNDYTISVE